MEDEWGGSETNWADLKAWRREDFIGSKDQRNRNYYWDEAEQIKGIRRVRQKERTRTLPTQRERRAGRENSEITKSQAKRAIWNPIKVIKKEK